MEPNKDKQQVVIKAETTKRLADSQGDPHTSQIAKRPKTNRTTLALNLRQAASSGFPKAISAHPDTVASAEPSASSMPTSENPADGGMEMTLGHSTIPPLAAFALGHTERHAQVVVDDQAVTRDLEVIMHRLEYLSTDYEAIINVDPPIYLISQDAPVRWAAHIKELRQDDRLKN